MATRCISSLSRLAGGVRRFGMRNADNTFLGEAAMTIRRHATCWLTALLATASCVSVPLAQAQPYGDTPAERQYLAQADQYLARPRPTDVLVLQLGNQACQVRRGGGSSDEAKVAIWNTWNSAGIRPASGAEVGSLVHVAVDTLCPEVGYP